MRIIGPAFRMQLSLALRTPNYWMAMITTVPQVILFLSVVEAFDRPDLITNALMAPILMTMWSTALWTGGSVMRDDRWQGRLEIHAASPPPYGLVVAARVGAVVMLSCLSSRSPCSPRLSPTASTSGWTTGGCCWSRFS